MLACWVGGGVAACGERPPSASTASVVGSWRSKEFLSQVGPTVVSYGFGADGTYTTETVFRMLPDQPLRMRGTYRVEGGRITMTGDGHASEMTVDWEGPDLVLTERNGDRYKLSRVGGR